MSYFRTTRDKFIHVVDPDLRSCEVVCAILRIEGYGVSFSTKPEDLWLCFAHSAPDMLIINGCFADEVLPAVHMRSRGTPSIIILDDAAGDNAVEQTVAAVKRGACDVFAKPVDSERLLTTIRGALAHDSYPASQGRYFAVANFRSLTHRECEVLQLITNGQSNKEAGRELGISSRTVEVHRARVMQKLGAKNTADLMRIVLSN